jgi:MFS family permease
VIGGLLVTELSWRWVFYVNVPLGILAIAFGAFFLQDRNGLQPGPFDTAGFILAGTSLGLLMYGVSEGPIRHWSSGIHDADAAATMIRRGSRKKGQDGRGAAGLVPPEHQSAGPG